MSGNSTGVSQPTFREVAPPASDAPRTAICAGASFSIYVLRELIGVGTSASVYRAHDARLRREVAVKILNTGALPHNDGVARFLHEARMAAAVRHPNVVSILDVGVHDGAPYIVMELLEGEDLDTRLSIARVLREPVLIDIGLQLVSGLAAVHDTGVVHRDLRPSNVFLVQGTLGTRQAKLLDFSISKQTRDHLRLTTNGRRRWAAMPLYTAPEVLLDGDATFQSDQYSLGVLLYECVTGVNPFRADTTAESIELITTGQARRPREQPIRPSRRLAAIIEKAMHVYPERRFGDLHELGEALASLTERRALVPWRAPAAPAPTSTTRPRPNPWTAPPERAPSERYLGWALGSAVIAGSIAAPVWAWWSVHRQRDAAPASVAAPLAPPPLAAAPVAPDRAAVAGAQPAPGVAASPATASGVPFTTGTTGAASATPGGAPVIGALPDAVPAVEAMEPIAALGPIENSAFTNPALANPALAGAASPFTHPGATSGLQPVAPALESSALAPGGTFAPAPGAGSADGASGEGTAEQASLAPPGALPAEATAASGADSGPPPPDDGSALEGADPSAPVDSTPLTRHERGTNGALIFD